MKKLILCASLVCLGMMYSCTKEELVPEGEKPEWLGESIYEELQNPNPEHLNGTFSTYLRLVDDLDYKEVLSRTGSMTVFPANDDAFNRFFSSENAFGVHSYEELTISQKKLLLNSSLLKNAMLASMLSNIPADDNNVERGRAIKHETNVSVIDDVQFLSGGAVMPAYNTYWDQYRTTGLNAVFDGTVPMMVHLTREQMLANDITTTGQDSDFGIIRGENVNATVANADTAYIFQNKIIKQDVVCQNGYIHQLKDVLVPPGNMAQVLKNQPNTKLFSRLLDYYCAPYFNQDITNSYNDWARQNGVPVLDKIYEVRYFSQKSQNGLSNNYSPDEQSVPAMNRLIFDPGWNQYYASSVASNSLNDMAAVFAPTDSALADYFLPGGNGADYIAYFGNPNLLNTRENLPENLDTMFVRGNGLLTSIINNLLQRSFVNSVPSKFYTLTDAGSGDAIGVTKYDIHQENGKYDIALANNGVVYKMDKVFVPHEMQSVIGPTLTFPGMNVMKMFVSDKTSGTGPSIFGADMYYYLLAMKSNYAFFSMKDDNMANNPIIDPVSLGKQQPRALAYYTYQNPKYNSDGSIARYETAYGVKIHNFNKTTGQIDPTPSAVEEYIVDKNGNTQYGVQVTDMLNYQTLVLGEGEELGVNKYYLTKHGGAIELTNFKQITDAKGNISFIGTVKGGAQIQFPDLKPSTIVEGAPKENGYALMVDAPVQPAITSLYSLINSAANKDNFTKFMEIVNGIMNSNLLTWLGVPTAVYDNSKNPPVVTVPSKQDNYVTFTADNALDQNVKFFNGYNYTFFAPDNAAVEIAQNDMGLPTIAKINEIYTEYSDPEAGYTEDQIKQAKKDCLAMVDCLRAFVKYHFMNNSVFADNYRKPIQYQSMHSSDLGLAANLNVKSDAGILSVADATAMDAQGNVIWSKAHTINANSSALVNAMTRDYVYNDQAAQATAIANSSFAVVHQVSKPLCFEKERYDIGANGQKKWNNY